MQMKKMMGGLAIALIAGVTVYAAEVKLDDIKCVVAPKPAKATKSADYKDAKVYFCCDGCAGKFSKAPEKFATKANHQLVATKQFKQEACPMSGNPLNAETETKVAGVAVQFCCNGCKGKVDSAEGDEKIALVFADKPFEKGFKKLEQEKE
ncbi:YHS domain protein [Planctomycetes bacterium CA13]|uniref:YHS domain protein n=1 Tax=Novipirellula herctigrandis TaxID=2527986 RepID=A0A5C5Z0U5_9BACT|nr:YHS domain protein [Planctomycetes bacterium CA13]